MSPAWKQGERSNVTEPYTCARVRVYVHSVNAYRFGDATGLDTGEFAVGLLTWDT